MPIQAVSIEIFRQLGGNKFRVMTGAKNFLYSANSLSFKLPANFAKDGINYVKVTLNNSDLYDVVFGKTRGLNYKELAKSENLYADMLQADFTNTTGLDTSL